MDQKQAPTNRKKNKRDERELLWVQQLVAQAQMRRFYGKLVLVMDDGEIRRVIKEESLKLPTGQ